MEAVVIQNRLPVTAYPFFGLRVGDIGIGMAERPAGDDRRRGCVPMQLPVGFIVKRDFLLYLILRFLWHHQQTHTKFCHDGDRLWRDGGGIGTAFKSFERGRADVGAGLLHKLTLILAVAIL